MHERLGVDDPSPERLPDALVPQADPENGDPVLERPDRVEGDPGLVRIAAREMPASSGPPGPGEMTSPAGFRSASSSTVIASLRNTSTSAPSSQIYCTRFHVKES